MNVGASAGGGKNGAALREVVCSAGNPAAAIGGKHPGFAIRHTRGAIAEVKPLNLIDVLPVEAGFGEISLGNEASHDSIAVSTSGVQTKQRNQA